MKTSTPPAQGHPYRAATIIALLALSCATPEPPAMRLLHADAFVVLLPPGFRAPPQPADNPVTLDRAELGRHLFYDRRLSLSQTQSCADCHQQSRAFTDGRVHAVGSTGEAHFRNTMSLANAAYRSPLTWASRDVRTLEAQVLIPLTRRDPIEMGMQGRLDLLIGRIRDDVRYRGLFARAFPCEPSPITVENVARALASFERTLISGDSPYDRLVRRGQSGALSESAWRGMRLFFSDRLACSSCHGGRDFDSPPNGSPFQNTGLYDIDGRGAYPARDPGLTEGGAFRGRFRVPSLRNVAATGPYMHDGSAATLHDVIDDYASGGRAARAGGRRARGVAVRPFAISDEEKEDLVAFLESLTDEGFLKDPRFGDPWK